MVDLNRLTDEELENGIKSLEDAYRFLMSIDINNMFLAQLRMYISRIENHSNKAI